jgi:hypothetical protein
MKRNYAVMVLLCVLGLFLSAIPMNVGAPIVGTSPPLTGNWEISDDTTVTDETVICNGSIIINSGGSLTLINSIIKINCATDGQYGIEVKSGGAVYILDDSTIDKHGVGNYYFMANDGASFEMRNSTLKNCGYKNVNDLSYTGLYLESDGLIEYSTIDVCCQGVVAENGTLTLKENIIKNSLWHNVVVRNEVLILDNNEITEAERIGVWAGINCDLIIKDNRIHNNTRSGIWVEQNSAVECYGNSIEWNGDTEAAEWDTSGHGFAGFDSDVNFHNNTVTYNWGHNFETTRCTAEFVDNHFNPSREKCNVEFFDQSNVTAKRNYIDGAGHNCFWVRDGVYALIEDNVIKNSPHNGIWSGNGCTMIIVNNDIQGCAESGIYSYNSTLTITDNDISDCEWWGIQAEGCDVIQSGNTFSTVTLGQIYYGHFITFKAVDSGGNAIQGASIKVKDSAGTEIWTDSTDATGITQHMMIDAQKVDTTGTSTSYSYTIEAEKDGMTATSDLSPDQSQTLTLNLESEEDDAEDNMTMILIIIIVVIVVVIILAVVLTKKKGKK